MRRKAIYAVVVLLGLLVAFALLFPAFDHHPALPRVNREVYSIVIAARAYRNEYGSFPTGSTVQIAAALSGQNPRQIVFIELPRKSIGPDGQFIDPWGVPYSVVYSSDSNVVVKSAGKDKIFGTADDIDSEK